jgi:hypothetical protein
MMKNEFAPVAASRDYYRLWIWSAARDANTLNRMRSLKTIPLLLAIAIVTTSATPLGDTPLRGAAAKNFSTLLHRLLTVQEVAQQFEFKSLDRAVLQNRGQSLKPDDRADAARASSSTARGQSPNRRAR